MEEIRRDGASISELQYLQEQNKYLHVVLQDTINKLLEILAEKERPSA